MNRNELIEAVALSTQMAPLDVRRCLECLFGTQKTDGVLAAALRDGHRVQWAHFGTFEARERAARQGLNPRTGERIRIEARRAVSFRPAGLFRRRLQGS